MFHDMDLLLLLRMMVEKVRSAPDRYESLRSIAGGWERSWKYYGPGVLDLELDSIASDSVKKAEFVELLGDLENSYLVPEGVWPADTVNQRWGVKGVKFSDYPSSRLLEAVAKIRALISPGYSG